VARVVALSINAWFGIVGAVLAGGVGVWITVHELRRRERRVSRREIDDLTKEVEALRELLLAQRRYIYEVVISMIDAGLDPPHPPDPSFDPDEYPDAKKPPDPSGQGA
jgi:hypothetical protein